MEKIIYDKDGNRVGYIGHFTGAYICDTCGAVCDCENEEESETK
jgi:hypothetical protein